MRGSGQWRRIVSYALIVLAALATALCLGKDYNWDMLGYHVYAGYNAFEHRLASDYFAASSQSYLNPYSHVPFYLMLKNGFAPQLVVALLALFHSLNLLIVYEIAALLNRRQDGAIAWPPVWLAVLLAFLNPVFLLELGNSFNDISTGVLVLAGYYLLLREFETQGPGGIAFAGVLVGAAASLKLSNLLFTVTALPLLLLSPSGAKMRLRALLAFSAGGLLGALLAGAWWAWLLWERFGNPFFPFFNEIFRSPDLVDRPLKHYRFVSNSLVDLLYKPFAMTVPKPGVHIETAAPDLRYAALFVLLCLFSLKYALRRMGLSKWSDSDPFPVFRQQRALLALSASVLLAWLAWAFASGNSRYFLPLASLSAVVLACLLFRFSGKWRLLACGVAPLTLMQAAMVAYMADLRWEPVKWGSSWFELGIPAELQRPTLYLHVGALPASFLLPFLPPGSGMINLTGQYVLADNASIRALLAQHGESVRVMRRYSGAVSRPTARDMDVALIRFGLEADLDNCESVSFSLQRQAPRNSGHLYYVACPVKPRTWPAAERVDFETRRRRADAVFDRLELLCPRQFQPRGLATESDGQEFWRTYSNTDTLLKQLGSGVVSYTNMFTHVDSGDIGNIAMLATALPDKSRVCP
jgi:hypothetical protein